MEIKHRFRPNPELKLMDQVREVLRYHHYAYRTEQTYCEWIKRYLKYYRYEKHPKEMGAAEVERYLSHLATEGQVAASTQRQALNALVFLYREVLGMELVDMAPIRGRPGRKPPTVLTKEEVRQVLGDIPGTHRLMAQLLYGCGLRLMECIRLRVKDLDFDNDLIFVREGKGGKDRSALLAQSVKNGLRSHLDRVRELHREDLAAGVGEA